MSDFLEQMRAAALTRVQEARARRPLAPPHAPPAAGRFRRALAQACGRTTACAAPAGGEVVAGHARSRHVSAPARPTQLPADRSAPRLAVIAEIKRASPSRGAIAPALDAAAQAAAYTCAGAHAVSVLTEPDRFRGSILDLEAASHATRLPTLRKDFVVHAYQVWEAARAGAAAVLLIAGLLDDAELRALLGECRTCGLDALVETHDECELSRAAAAGADLVGINNRDLRTLQVDLATTERLATHAPRDALLVCESGVICAADARRAADAGAHAVLVGEALVRTPVDCLAGRIAELHRPLAARRGADETHGASSRPSPGGAP